MRASTILRELLRPCGEFLHTKTFGALSRFCTALLCGQRLTLTELGRAAAGPAKPKHRIKAANRLLGNRRLHAKIPVLYRGLARRWIRFVRNRPVILVDWTGLPHNFFAISASVAFQGRSVPVYAETHPEKKKANRRVEQRFLRSLRSVLPTNCHPTIVTDAGFYTEWCDDVEALGWDFVARIRNKTMYRDVVRGWLPIKALHPSATSKARSLGWTWLTKTKPRQRRIIYVRKRKTAHRTSRGYSTNANKCRARAKEPWVLATTLRAKPRQIVSIYAQRMQIEQNYRDLKNARFGWCLDQARSKSTERFDILLFIATVTILAVLLIGFVAEKQGRHRAHQANTSHRRVLSFFCLGNRILKEGEPVPIRQVSTAILSLAAGLYAFDA